MMKQSETKYLIIGNTNILNWAVNVGTTKHIQLCCFMYKNININTNAQYVWWFHMLHI